MPIDDRTDCQRDQEALTASVIGVPAVCLILIAAVLYGRQRIAPVETTIHPLPWKFGDQILPPTAPTGEDDDMPDSAARLGRWLSYRSVNWRDRNRDCLGAPLFIHVATHLWSRLDLSPKEISLLLADQTLKKKLRDDGILALRFSLEDFLDDDNSDGDPLDPAELTASGPGVDVWLFLNPVSSTTLINPRAPRG